MSDLFMSSERQMARISSFFPVAHGVPHVDDRRVMNAIVYIKNGPQWKDAPKGYGPHKTLYNRFIRWSRPWRLRPHLRGACHLGAEARADYDRLHRSEGTSHSSLLKKGFFPAVSAARKVG